MSDGDNLRKTNLLLGSRVTELVRSRGSALTSRKAILLERQGLLPRACNCKGNRTPERTCPCRYTRLVYTRIDSGRS